MDSIQCVSYVLKAMRTGVGYESGTNTGDDGNVVQLIKEPYWLADTHHQSWDASPYSS